MPKALRLSNLNLKHRPRFAWNLDKLYASKVAIRNPTYSANDQPNSGRLGILLYSTVHTDFSPEYCTVKVAQTLRHLSMELSHSLPITSDHTKVPYATK
jgi:hypothetical protein